MSKHRRVILTNEQKGNLEQLVSNDDVPKTVKTKARILLMTDRSNGYRTFDSDIIENLGISICTIVRTRKRFCDKGLDAVLTKKAHSHRKSKFNDSILHGAILSTIKNPPPMNKKRWTIQLISDHINAIGDIGPISKTCVYKMIKKSNIPLK